MRWPTQRDRRHSPPNGWQLDSQPKEAAMKVFGLSEAGIGWRDIEVRRAADGSCTLRLHREAARIAAIGGSRQIAVSLSHDGDYATAVVAAVPESIC
jgi:holo-[acyl-carrier protein] synthase